jgi:hypothetical protein
MTNAKLMTKAIDFVIGQEQWLVWVHVTLMEEDDTTIQERSCHFPVNPDATTAYMSKRNCPASGAFV